MIQTNEGLNSARMIATNGDLFIEDTASHTGVWYGIQPHPDGCKITALVASNSNGDTIDGTGDAYLASHIGTTLDLKNWIGCPNVYDTNSGRITKGYFTTIQLASGGASAYNDTISKD